MADFVNNCLFNPTAGGTTDWTVSTAVTGYMTPAAAGAVNGRTYKYRAESSDLTQWEYGEGVYTSAGTVLARTTVFQNSSGTTSKINFSTVPFVGIVHGREDTLLIDAANSFTAAQKLQARDNINVFAGKALAASQDLNNVIDSGTYHTIDNASTNAPAASSFWYLEVVAYSNTNYIMQRATLLEAGTAGSCYIRIRNAGSWGSWYPILTAAATAISAAFQAQMRTNMSAALRGHIAGLTLSNNATDATNDIDIAAGEAASTETNPVLMVLASALTKRLDAAWAVGTNQGGLDTGSIANTTYHIWLIQRSDTGVVDVLFSISASSPTMPANYDRKRRIGAIVRVSAAIKAFLQIGDHFMWKTAVADASAVNATTTPANVTLTVPSGIVVQADLQVDWTNTGIAGAIVLIYCPTIGTQAAGTPTGNWSVANSVANQFVTNALQVETNTSAQVAHVAGGSSNNSLYIITRGWFDLRGKDS